MGILNHAIDSSTVCESVKRGCIMIRFSVGDPAREFFSHTSGLLGLL